MQRYSIGDTEDLYCDDELDPSLENDPNMRLYTENINITMESGLLDIGDDGNSYYDGNIQYIVYHVYRVYTVYGDTQYRPTVPGKLCICIRVWEEGGQQ